MSWRCLYDPSESEKISLWHSAHLLKWWVTEIFYAPDRDPYFRYKKAGSRLLEGLVYQCPHGGLKSTFSPAITGTRLTNYLCIYIMGILRQICTLLVLLLYFGIFGKPNLRDFPSILNFQAGKPQLWHATKSEIKKFSDLKVHLGMASTNKMMRLCENKKSLTSK